MSRDDLWPDGTRADASGELWLGGCAASALADEYGTPLYIFDEGTLRARARAYREALRRFYPGSAQIAYASKAYLCLAIARIFAEENLDLDVVSGGELFVALRAGFPPARIHFHGNNKTRDELAQALHAGVGRIVVDNFHELETVAAMVAERGVLQGSERPVPVWLRLAPGVQPHTHAHIQTGQEDTKFGFSIASGDAERAVALAARDPGLSLLGLHCHIGSQIHEPETLADAAARLARFAAAMRDRHGFVLRELSPGGGWGVPMVESDPAEPIEPYVAAVAEAVVHACREAGLDLPHLVLEPGRSMVAQAGVALYRAGARKDIPGVRSYVSVDGGMADNIRPALYGAKYTALVVPCPRPKDAGRDPAKPGPSAGVVPACPGAATGARPGGAGRCTRTAPTGETIAKEIVTLAGKFCESGDVLIRDIELPRLQPGDFVAIPMAGAYTLSMASNYNLALRPAVLLVGDGSARLIQRRETFEDLIHRDVPLGIPAIDLPAEDQGKEKLSIGESISKPIGWQFHKYQALGNDYLVLDPLGWPEPPDPELIRRICDRHLGVGADGILWGPIGSTEPFGVRMFNPDGTEFEKSGNGLRIFARYLWDRRRAPRDFAIRTPAGLVVAHLLDAQGAYIAMEMGQLSFDSPRGAEFHSANIPVIGLRQEVIEETVTLGDLALRITAVTIGNPHCVVFLDRERDSGSLEEMARQLGPALEHLPLYPHGTNVQFAEVLDRHTLQIAIWERGVGYALASGTSSCAAAGAAIRTGRCDSPVAVQMPGGAMLVEIAPDWSVRLTGSVAPVCHGELAGDLVHSAGGARRRGRSARR